MKSHWEKWQLLSAWHIRGKVEKSNDALNGFRNCNNINGTEDVSYSGPWVMVPISFAYLARFTKGLRCDFKLSWHEQICKLCKVGMIWGDHQSPTETSSLQLRMYTKLFSWVVKTQLLLSLSTYIFCQQPVWERIVFCNVFDKTDLKCHIHLIG